MTDDKRVDELEKTMRDLLFALNHMVDVSDAPPAVKEVVKKLAKQRSDETPR